MKTYQVVAVFEVEAESLEEAETNVEVWSDDLARLPPGCSDFNVVEEDDEDLDGQRVYYFPPREEE